MELVSSKYVGNIILSRLVCVICNLVKESSLHINVAIYVTNV